MSTFPKYCPVCGSETGFWVVEELKKLQCKKCHKLLVGNEPITRHAKKNIEKRWRREHSSFTDLTGDNFPW